MGKNCNCTEYLKKYFNEIVCFIFFLCIIIRIYFPFFSIIGFLVLMSAIIYRKNINGIIYVCFAYCFRFLFRYKSNESFLFVGLLTIWLLTMVINFIVEKKYRYKQYWLPLLFIGIFFAYILFPRNGLSGVMGSIKLAMVIISLYFVYVYRDSLQVKNIVYYFSISLLLSSLLGTFKPYNSVLNDMIGVEVTYYKSLRFMGIDRDPNFYTVTVWVCLSSLFVLYLKNYISKMEFYPFCVMLLSCGFATISKSFLIGLLIFFISFVISVVKKKNFCFDYLLMFEVLIIVFMICHDSIILLFDRFNVGDLIINGNLDISYIGQSNIASNNTLNDLTTGRLDIWIMYIKELLSNPVALFLGNGFGKKVQGSASHNTIIQGTYAIGLIGMLYLGVLAGWLLIKIIRQRTNIYEYIPLVIFFTLSMALDFLISTSVACYGAIIIGIINYTEYDKKTIFQGEFKYEKQK